MESLARSLLEYTGTRAIERHLPWLARLIEWIAVAAEVAAVVVLTLGAVRFAWALAHGHLVDRGGAPVQRIRAARASFRLYILAGLDLFIVSDIIHTVISQAFADLLFVGLLVGIRLVLGVSLERAAQIDPPDQNR